MIKNIRISKLFFSGTILICFITFGTSVLAQTTVTFNFLSDVELSKAGEKSHFYYNEIDQNNQDWRIGISQSNLLLGVVFNTNWSLNSRFLLERDLGRTLDKFTIPQLNVKWISDKRKYGITIGLFNNPFGAFNQTQLSTKRKFIGLPLAYSFYQNISPSIGYLADMGDVTKVSVDGDVQWGSSMLYYGGYASGAMWSWNIKPNRASLKLAIVTGAGLNQNPSFSVDNIGLSSRLKLQPTYYWEHAFSIHIGTFMQSSEFSNPFSNLPGFTQTVIGTDFKLGKGYFEFSGELIGSQYKVLGFNSADMTFISETIDDPFTLRSISGYVDVKYEFPFLVGGYISLRTDHLRFGKVSDTDENWDNNVMRHSIGFGYDINKYLLLRMSYSMQDIENKVIWDNKQNTFRLMLTVHY
jgi:hypothetical protein